MVGEYLNTDFKSILLKIIQNQLFYLLYFEYFFLMYFVLSGFTCVLEATEQISILLNMRNVWKGMLQTFTNSINIITQLKSLYILPASIRLLFYRSHHWPLFLTHNSSSWRKWHQANGAAFSSLSTVWDWINVIQGAQTDLKEPNKICCFHATVISFHKYSHFQWIDLSVQCFTVSYCINSMTMQSTSSTPFAFPVSVAMMRYCRESQSPLIQLQMQKINVHILVL